MEMYIKPPSDVICPTFKQAMSECCPTCVKWRKIRGAHPLTGEELDGFQCSDVLTALALFEVGKEIRQTGAAIESTRNEVVRRMNLGLASMVPEPKPRLLSFLGGKK